MHIKRVRIRNYRNFLSAELRFSAGVNTLIGENGSGKTNAFQAIRLLLDDALPRKSVALKESDFNRSLGNWRGHWVIISLDFAELDSSEGCQIIRHATEHMTDEGSGTYTYIFRPNKEVRNALFEKSQAQSPDLNAFISNIDINQYEAIFTGRGAADVCDNGVYESLAGNFRTNVFPNPDEDDALLIGTRVFQPIHQEVSCTFVKALRDVVSDLRNYRDSPLLNLLRGKEKNIALSDAELITDAIAKLNTDISDLPEIRKLSTEIQDSLHSTVGFSYSPAIDIQSSLPADMEKLLQGLALSVSDPLDSGHQGSLGELSLGGASLIYLSLKLLEYEMKSAGDRVAHFLMIEEPESHIHTHIQKTLFEKYGYSQTQVIVSTHSTHISAASKIRTVNVLAKEMQHAVVFHPSNGMSHDECSRIERYLDAVRSTLLFAKGILLVEGDAEQILLPSLVRHALGVSLDELGVSLVSMSSAVFDDVARVFGEDRVRRRCAIVTDHDAAFVPLPADAAGDTDAQSSARASQKSGEERAVKLNALCNGNKWLGAFYAKHTFEVDLFIANNHQLYEGLVETLYKRPTRIAASKERLKDANIATWATELLKVLKKGGKGWCALHVAAIVDSHTAIPAYILDALAFASEKTLEVRTVHLMLCHRIMCYQKDGADVSVFTECLARKANAVTLELIRKDIETLKTFSAADPLAYLFSKVELSDTNTT